MAIELPRASAGSVGSGRFRRAVQLPGAGDVPRQEIARDPGVRVPDLGGAARGLESVGAGLTDLGMALQRQRKLNDANRTTEALLSFERETAEEFRRRQTEDDFSRPDFLKEFEGDLSGRLKESISGLAGVSEEAMTRARLRMQASLQGTVEAAGRLSLIAEQQRAVDSIDGVVNQLSAQASDDPEFLNFILDDLGERLGEYDGTLTADQERDQLSSARQNIILSGVSGLVRGNRFNDAELVLGQFDADLSPEQRSRAQAAIDLGRKQAIAERERAARLAVGNAMTVLKFGKTPADLDNVTALAKGTDFEAPLKAAVEDADTVREFVGLPMAEQASRLGEFSKQETATAREVTLADSMMRAHAGVLKAIEDGNGIAVAADAGVIEELAEISLDDPASLTVRAAQADIASAWAGRPVSPLTAAESDGVAAAIVSAMPGQVVGMLDALHDGLGRDQAIALAGSIAPKRPELAVAIAMSPDLPGMSRDIISGGRVLRENPEAKASKVQHIEALEAVAGNLFTPESASVMDDFLAAADTLYANQFAQGQFVFDQGIYEETLRTVMGGPFEFNERIILPPAPGMSEDAFDILMDGLKQPDLIEYGSGVPMVGDGPFTVDMFDRGIFHDDAQLISVGPGRYAVNLPGLGTVMTETGVYVLDLRRFLDVQ